MLEKLARNKHSKVYYKNRKYYTLQVLLQANITKGWKGMQGTNIVANFFLLVIYEGKKLCENSPRLRLFANSSISV
jgi:hypothetical protein